MMTKTTHTKILVRCDVGLCDLDGVGSIYATKNGQDPGLLLAELQAAGWLLGGLDPSPNDWTLREFDACPSCKEKMQARRGEPMEDPDGA